jgi:glycosyltransferase involved in cell wall biosynthesis
MPVSIVIPTHNMASYLGLAIESVLRQTHSDWDLHVVDDGSTDATAELVARYKNDQRIHYWYQTNQERAAARNRGITNSSGKYVAFLDADDLWEPEKLHKQVAALESNPGAALCYTYARYIRRDGTPLPNEKQLTACEGYVLPDLVRGNFIPVSSVLVRRSALDTAGMFDISRLLTGAEDWDLWLRIALEYPIKAVCEELTLYRVHDTPHSHRAMLKGALAVLDKRFSDPDFANRARTTKTQAQAYAYFGTAGFASSTVTRAERLKLLLKGWWISPASLVSDAGLLALGRLLLPFSVVTALKERFVKFLGFRRKRIRGELAQNETPRR